MQKPLSDSIGSPRLPLGSTPDARWCTVWKSWARRNCSAWTPRPGRPEGESLEERCPNFIQLRFNQKHATDCHGWDANHSEIPRISRVPSFWIPRTTSCRWATCATCLAWRQIAGWWLDGRPFIGIRQSPFRQVPAYPGLQVVQKPHVLSLTIGTLPCSRKKCLICVLGFSAALSNCWVWSF